MFCANASGRFLPPMVVYEAKNVYPVWIKGVPSGARFDAAESGCFNASTLSRWFFEILLPQLRRDDPFAVIGDNLGSHFSAMVIEACKEKELQVHNFTTKFKTPLPAIRFCCFFGWSKPGDRCWRSGGRNQGAKDFLRRGTSLYYWTG